MFILMVMKKKTWLNTISMSFYPYGLALKGAWRCFFNIVYGQNSLDWKNERKHYYLSPMIIVYLMQMIEKRRHGKRKRNHFYDQKKKKKKFELWHLNFLPLLEDYLSLTLFLIINFFRARIGLSIRIGNRANTWLSYLSIVKIITGTGTKWH